MTNQSQELITVKQLADRASISPPKLRKILRTRFPRETKGKSYGWKPDDPQIDLILKAVKSQKTGKPKSKPKAKGETGGK